MKMNQFILTIGSLVVVFVLLLMTMNFILEPSETVIVKLSTELSESSCQ